MVVPRLADRTYNMGGNNLYDSSVDSYGTIQQGAGMRNIGRPKISTAAKIAPMVFIVALLGLASIATVLNKDERQMDQVTLCDSKYFYTVSVNLHVHVCMY